MMNKANLIKFFLLNEKIIDFIIIIIIAILSLYFIDYKIELTNNAKNDMIIINNLFINNIHSDLKFQIIDKSDSVSIISNNLPYQTCLRYGIEFENYSINKIIINGDIYIHGHGIFRDNILKSCLKQNESIVELINYKKGIK